MRFAATIATSVTGTADLKTVATRERSKAHLCDGHHIPAGGDIHIIHPARAGPRRPAAGHASSSAEDAAMAPFQDEMTAAPIAPRENLRVFRAKDP